MASEAWLGCLARLLELRLYDGRLANRDGFWCWNGIPSGVLGRHSRRLEWRREVGRPLLCHLIVSRVKELLLKNKQHCKFKKYHGRWQKLREYYTKQ